MEITQWWPWYQKIDTAFGYSIERDREATSVLRDLLSGRALPLAELQGYIQNRRVIVFGAGPSLEKNLCSIISAGLEDVFTLIAADGATSAFLKESIVPNLIVTDLDGRIDDILKAGELGSIIVVHCHGDNIDKLREFVPNMTKNKRIKVFGTTQVEPLPPVIYNFGGFTDGDRCAFLAEEMKADMIILAGMDMGTTIGKFSKEETYHSSPEDKSNWLSIKKQKLEFAKELLEWLATWSKASGGLFNATGLKGETVKGFSQIQLRQLVQIATSTRK
jgi:hypothetical protein